jgi:hypothetical protein
MVVLGVDDGNNLFAANDAGVIFPDTWRAHSLFDQFRVNAGSGIFWGYFQL